MQRSCLPLAVQRVRANKHVWLLTLLIAGVIAAAEAALSAELSAGRLTSLGGKSEATGLADHSVDVIIAAQVLLAGFLVQLGAALGTLRSR
jgi:hypothetical protein